MSLEISASTVMEEILNAYPSAKLGLFRQYHIGGCTACGYQPARTRWNRSWATTIFQTRWRL